MNQGSGERSVSDELAKDELGFVESVRIVLKNEGKFKSSVFESEMRLAPMAVAPNIRMFSGWSRTSQQVAPKQESSTGSSKVRLPGSRAAAPQLSDDDGQL